MIKYYMQETEPESSPAPETRPEEAQEEILAEEAPAEPGSGEEPVTPEAAA